MREATNRTDQINLIQIHWLDRYVHVFGQTTFQQENKQDNAVLIEETALALRNLIEEGNFWYMSLSNKITLGMCEWVAATQKYGICA